MEFENMNPVLNFLSNGTSNETKEGKKCECEYEKIHNTSNSKSITCEYVRKCCNGEYFNILSLNYCYINFTPVTLPIVILILLICFYFLSSTGNDYLANSLGIISEKMKISQNLAGVTFLALGNQAPDVAVAFVAGEGSEGGVAISFSSLLCSGSIVISLVLSTVIILGNGVSTSKGNYLRDLLFYLGSLIIILIFGMTRIIRLWMAICIFGIYIVYVIICIFMDVEGKKNEEENNISEVVNKDFQVKLFNERSQSIDLITSLISEEPNIDNIKNSFENETPNKVGINDNENEENRESTTSKSGFDLYEHVDKGYFAKKNVEPEGRRSSIRVNQYSDFRFSAIRNYIKMHDSTPFEEKSQFGKIFFYIIDLPFNFIRDITIPAFELKKWNKKMFSAIPFGLSIFFTVAFKLYFLYAKYPLAIAIYYICILILCLIFYSISYKGKLPKWEWLLLAFAFLISIIWIWAVTNILVNMVEAIQMLLPIEIPEVFLTMTILALGNSLPDFIVNCSLASNNYAEMALAGSIGAPVFGLTFGFGVSLLKRIILNGGKGLELNLRDPKDTQTQYIIFSACSNIILTVIFFIIIGFIQQFKLKKFVGYIGYSIYTCYFIALIYFSFIYKK
jgi:sodium/potassium/calcium exchanger 6